MGYTHYWEAEGKIDPAQYKAALSDIGKIVTSQSKVLANGMGDEGTKPKVTSGITFNGIGDAAQ